MYSKSRLLNMNTCIGGHKNFTFMLLGVCNILLTLYIHTLNLCANVYEYAIDKNIDQYLYNLYNQKMDGGLLLKFAKQFVSGIIPEASLLNCIHGRMKYTLGWTFTHECS